jgi:hypothetical protein
VLQELLQKMERVFSAEDLRIKSTLATLGDSEEDTAQSAQLSRQLVENLLCPLGGSIYDIEHLNRRQAAALMGYIVDPSSDVQKVVKAWIKTLKEKNIGKYLESILVALKKSYEERIRPLLAQHRDAIEQFGRDDDDDHEDYPAMLAEEGASLLSFSVKLAQSLGVGKAKGQTKDFLVMFFKVGMSYALQEIDNAGFIMLLEPFLKLLSETEAHTVQEEYEEVYGSAPEQLRVLCEAGDSLVGEDNMDERVIYAFCLDALGAFAGKLGVEHRTSASVSLTAKRSGSGENYQIVDNSMYVLIACISSILRT